MSEIYAVNPFEGRWEREPVEESKMKPYYERDGISLYHADCLEFLPTLASGAVDACITDPPYGIAYKNKRSDIVPREFAPVIAGDGDMETGQAMIDQCLAHDWPICTFSYHRTSWHGQWRQHLVWDKGPAVGGGGDPATCWKFTWELILVGGFGKINGQRDSAVLRYWIGQADSNLHPNQKPLPLMEYLVEKLTQQGETILDPFAGSCTTGVAAWRLGRRCILCEISEEYCELGAKRIDREISQGRLFAPEPATVEQMEFSD